MENWSYCHAKQAACWPTKWPNIDHYIDSHFFHGSHKKNCEAVGNNIQSMWWEEGESVACSLSLTHTHTHTNTHFATMNTLFNFFQFQNRSTGMNNCWPLLTCITNNLTTTEFKPNFQTCLHLASNTFNLKFVHSTTDFQVLTQYHTLTCTLIAEDVLTGRFVTSHTHT